MATENEKFVYRWFDEVWNEGRVEAVDEMFAADGIAHGLGEYGRDAIGPEAFKPFVRRLKAAFPDLRFTVDGTIEQGDQIATRFSVTMTHTGDDLGFPATGRHAEVTGISVCRIKDGQIVEAWNNWDVYGLMQQLDSNPLQAKLLGDV